jgi:hypothetical protein
MPPRRNPSQANSRPPSPIDNGDEVRTLNFRERKEIEYVPNFLRIKGVFFDSVDELQQHVGTPNCLLSRLK